MISPAVIGATGGSGTRALKAALVAYGAHFGASVNLAGDAAEFIPVYDTHVNPTLASTRSLDYRLDELPEDVREPALAAFREATLLYRRDFDPAGPWGIKGPRSMYMLPYLAEALPGFAFLHLVRDGRDMAVSRNQGQLLRHYTALFDETPGKDVALASARLWRKANLEAADWAEANLKARYLRVRFEDLCGNTEETLAGILDFLSWPHDGARVERMAARIEAPQGIGRWRRQDAARARAVETLIADALVRFGYELTAP